MVVRVQKGEIMGNGGMRSNVVVKKGNEVFQSKKQKFRLSRIGKGLWLN